MRLSQRKKKRGAPPTQKLMLQFGSRYDPETKILITQKGEKLQKYSHGYFQIDKLNKKSITRPMKKLLESYPKWIIDQKVIKTQVFQNFFRLMIEAHPKQLFIFQQQSQIKSSLLREVYPIRFPYLNKLSINFQSSPSLEPLSWIEAPLLQQIFISLKTVISSLNPLAKINFPNLRILKLSIGDGKISRTRNYDLSKISRIRMKNINREQNEIELDFVGLGNIFRKDVSDLSILAKIQMQKLPNLKIPGIKKGATGRYLNMMNMVRALTRRYEKVENEYNLKMNQIWSFSDEFSGMSDEQSDNVFDMDKFMDKFEVNWDSYDSDQGYQSGQLYDDEYDYYQDQHSYM